MISYLQLRGSFSKGCPPAAQNSRIGGKLQTELPAKDPQKPFLFFLCGGGQDARAGDQTFDKILLIVARNSKMERRHKDGEGWKRLIIVSLATETVEPHAGIPEKKN